MTEKFLKWRKETDFQVQEAQRVPNKMKQDMHIKTYHSSND